MMSTETIQNEPKLVDESVLKDLDRERALVEANAVMWQGKASGATERANLERRKLPGLAAVRGYLAARLGRPYEEVLAEAQAELEKAEVEAAAAEAEVTRLREWQRDLEGHKRVLEHNLANRPANSTA